MTELIKKQLDQVQYADLSNFNAETATYLIKKRVDMKIQTDSCYLIRLKQSARSNMAVITNWNSGSMPNFNCFKADISKIMGKMIKVVAVGYDERLNQDIPSFWSGWLNIDDIEVILKL